MKLHVGEANRPIIIDQRTMILNTDNLYSVSLVEMMILIGPPNSILINIDIDPKQVEESPFVIVDCGWGHIFTVSLWLG